MAQPTDSYGLANRLVSAIAPQNNKTMQFRTDRRGEQIHVNLFNGIQGPAVEGSYCALTAAGTIDTGITLSPATGTTFATTQAMCVIFNGEPLDGSGKDIILDYFKIYQITVNTAGVLERVIHYLDRGNRYASGGTAMSVAPVNGNGVAPSGLIAYAGAVTATAASSEARLLGSNIILNGVGVKGAEYGVKFADQGVAGGFAIPTTAVASYIVQAPPVVIPPGWSYVMNEFQTSRSGAGTGEFYAGFIAR